MIADIDSVLLGCVGIDRIDLLELAIQPNTQGYHSSSEMIELMMSRKTRVTEFRNQIKAQAAPDQNLSASEREAQYQDERQDMSSLAGPISC